MKIAIREAIPKDCEIYGFYYNTDATNVHVCAMQIIGDGMGDKVWN